VKRKTKVQRAQELLAQTPVDEIVHESGVRAVAYPCLDCDRVGPLSWCDCDEGKRWVMKAR
jgi:hypothetical protein